MSPDGESIVSGSEDATVVLWDIEHRHKVMEAKMHSSVKAVAFAPDGKYIAAGDEDGFIGIWKVDGDVCEEAGNTTVEGSVLSIALTSKPCLMAVGTTCKKVVLFDVLALEEIAELRHDGDVHTLSFTKDGETGGRRHMAFGVRLTSGCSLFRCVWTDAQDQASDADGIHRSQPQERGR